MSTEVLLMNDVAHLGQAGAVVRVADGYARNFLFPRKLAAPVSAAALKRLDKIRKEREELDRIQLAEAREKAAKLKDVSLTIRAKTSDGQKLYGSVDETAIVTALASQGIALDRGQIALDGHIKELGAFDVPLRLHPQVSATVKVWVVEE
jgi:large subunit ribosomal protein L9